jgi:hypothetical protein
MKEVRTKKVSKKTYATFSQIAKELQGARTKTGVHKKLEKLRK